VIVNRPQREALGRFPDCCDCRLPDCRLSVVDCRLPIADCRLPFDRRFQIDDSSFINYRSPIIDSRDDCLMTLYNVSLSTGSRPAARISDLMSSVVRVSGVRAPAMW